jgi:hypothetical protein
VEQYHKLFDKAEIEYITPFLKLWMSFNNWYKRDLPDIKTDRKAIDEYKKSGKIKNEFLTIYNNSSDRGINFNYSLFGLILNLKNYELKNHQENIISYSCIEENKNGRNGNYHYISEQEKRFQILEEDKELFFQETLDIIYCIRSNLVHGSFDIENIYFQKIVESCYKILQPIMYKVLEFEEIENLKEENQRLTNENESLKSSLKLLRNQQGVE